VGEEVFSRRFSLNPEVADMTDLGKLRKEDLETLGLDVIEVRTPTEMIPGVYLTGKIERETSYEKVPPTLLIQRGERIEPDDFRGEQAIFVNIKGKGLVVLSGCAHAGIVNTVKHVQKVTAIDKIHAVLGGFHLINAPAEVIQNTVADIKAMRPDHIIPTHCSGFEAISAFAGEMPAEFNLNTAGTQYSFGG
jgi:7,8-dihydropterin-6-yl-methyl-4-(beta-D-ribofuranosyl)aminobenzene 5'-phosphate synthase